MTLSGSSGRSLPSLASIARQELRNLRQAKMTATLEVVKPYIPHPPSERQREFLGLDVEEALFGGSTRGGKSDAGLMAALQYVDVPSYSAGIFRLTDEDWKKPDSLYQRAKGWFEGTPARWDPGVNGFRFPTGATIHFGSGYNGNIESLRRAYQGVPFQFIFVDELTQWDEPCYRFLFSRLVRLATQRNVPLRMRASSNPDGSGREWVRDRFVEYAVHVDTEEKLKDSLQRRRQDGAPMPRPRVYRSPPSPESVEVATALGRVAQGAHFVPSFLEDNPGIDVPEYRLSLAKLDTVEREQLEHGDWWVEGNGKVFEKEWFTKYLDAEPPSLEWIRYWDLAATDPTLPAAKTKKPAFTAGVKLALWFDETAGVRLVIGDSTRAQKEPTDRDLFIKATADLDGVGISQIFEREPGSAGKSQVNSFARTLLRGHDVREHRKTGDKPTMWRPLASLARVGGVYLVRGEWNRAFVAELVGLPFGWKDQADAAAGGYAWLLEQRGEGPPPPVDLDVDTGVRESPWKE
jgi:phage terminase large subunit-like protein